MLKSLGNTIEKRPWLVISLVLLVTIGFTTIIPGIEMKTDFKEFMPEDEVVQSYWRIVETLGQSQQMMFVYIEKQRSDSTITPEALREQYYIGNELLKISEVSGVLSIITILDQACQLEFGNTIENCTDEQINTALEDILGEEEIKTIKLFNNDDPNEEVDYNRYPKILKGKSIDEIDVKNCHINYDEETISFIIEVYDLSKLESNIKSPIPLINIVEWYIDFENIIRPDPMLDIEYKITARIEPKHPLWEIGKGPLKNIKDILERIRNRELFNSYKKEAYLWIKQAGQGMSFPLPLETAEINFDTAKNQIEIKASREELGKYGIALRYGFFELPAKLTNFKAGTRYYKSPIGNLPWFRVTANMSFIFDSIDKIRNIPVLSDIAGRLLKNFADLTWEDFDQLFEYTDEFVSLPDQIALKEIEESWENSDFAPNSGVSENILFIKTPFLDELRINALGFISNDYEETKKPIAAIMILNLNISWDYDETVKSTEFLLNKFEELDAKYSAISVEVTGDGVITVQMNKVTNESNTIIMPLIFIVIIAVLYISFRRVSYVLLPLLALVVSMIWIFGTMVLFGITFTTMSVAIVPLVMGLGVDYSVHLSHSYRLELAKGKTPGESIKKSVLEIGTAMFLAMLTTVIAFLSFLSASVPPLRDLGLLLALGILYTFITAITLQASVRYILDRKKDKFNIRKKKTFKLNKFMGLLAKVILSHQKKVLAILVLITVVSAVGATQIETGFDFYSFIPEDNPAIKIYTNIEKYFPFVGQEQEFILYEGKIADTGTIRSMMLTHENLKDDTFVGKKADDTPRAESIYTIIQQATTNNISLIEEFNLDERTKIPKTNQDLQRFYDYLWDSMEFGTQTQLHIHKSDDGTYEAALIRIYIDIIAGTSATIDFEKDIRLMYNELKDDVVEYGEVDIIVTGNFVMTHVITTNLSTSQMISTGISLVLATLVLIIAYRRLTLGIIAILPVVVSIVWILGTMYFIGYNLNILTIMVTSLTIGVGVDYAIHATERFKLVADKTGDIKAALVETISKTGGALLIAALTTTLGFGMLTLVPIPPEVQFGVIMVMTITYSFITSVLLLPLILARWAKWAKKRKGYIISPKPPDKEFIEDINSNKD